MNHISILKKSIHIESPMLAWQTKGPDEYFSHYSCQITPVQKQF